LIFRVMPYAFTLVVWKANALTTVASYAYPRIDAPPRTMYIH